MRLNRTPGPVAIAPGLVFFMLMCGCLSERSIPMRADDLLIVNAPQQAEQPNAREWLKQTHEQLARLLPQKKPTALLTSDLSDANGQPIDVFKHFHVNPNTLESLLLNSSGLQHTAQATGGDFDPDAPPPAWPGYEQIWIPVDKDFSLAGWIAFAKRDGQIIDADCIVILPGILGHNAIARTKAVADALLQSGLHVLALELRGHGQTDLKYPNVPYTFGPFETTDLLLVSEWLESQPHIRRTGLIGFCWGSNHALITAWYDSLVGAHESISPTLAPHMRQVSARPHYSAGMIAYSPVLRFEEIIDDVRSPRSFFWHPLLGPLQNTIIARSAAKHYPHHQGCLYTLIGDELTRCELNSPSHVDDAIQFVRLLPYKRKSDGDKLARVRMPVLIVQGVNDPLARAQDVADLMSNVSNPNVAAIILPGGGHIGFAPYARAYFYSLMINFFSKGPAAVISDS